KVALLEADRIGHGSSGRAAGWIADDPGIPFFDLERALGGPAARHAWTAWRRAALDFTALIRRLGIKCDLERRPTVTLGLSAEQIARFRREQKVRRRAGLDAPFVNPRVLAADVGIAGAGGIRTKDSATLDPYRATLGLAAAAAARGARLFEQSPAAKVTFSRRSAEVRTAGG